MGLSQTQIDQIKTLLQAIRSSGLETRFGPIKDTILFLDSILDDIQTREQNMANALAAKDEIIEQLRIRIGEIRKK